MINKLQYSKLVEYCGFDNLPEGLEDIYKEYEPIKQDYLIERDFLDKVYTRYNLTQDAKYLFTSAIETIEKDEKLFYFTKFLAQDMCLARNRCDVDNYHSLTPKCMSEFSTYYSFILLLACVTPAMKNLEKRDIPCSYYEKIPYNPMKPQFEKFITRGEVEVSDFPWDMNFYTGAIFLLDRFYFIPYRFGDKFTMYRNNKTQKVVALRHSGEEFRRDGQINGINGVYDEAHKFISIWEETENSIRANRINPMGYVECEPIIINKEEWKIVLKRGDMLLAVHIPSGPGYTPERLRTSTVIALDFYKKYFPELNIKGFWSESWLYDTRLSLVLDEQRSNILQFQKQLYIYPIDEGDGMLRLEAFGDRNADPMKAEIRTTLQNGIVSYMETGARFNTMSMIVLKEEVNEIGKRPYITDEDIEGFKRVVDTHLK